MKVTVANAGDQTVDPSKAWPEDRRGVEVGSLIVQQIEAEATAPVGTSISIRPFCRTAYGRRTIRSPPPALRPTGSPPTAARPRRKTIREPPRGPPNDERSAGAPGDDHSALHPAPANAALDHGRLHPGDAVHRRRHGFHGRAGIFDARQHSQTARDRVLILALIRLAVRLRYGAPPLPRDLPEPMKLAAYLSHYALYALMIAMPLIGWAMLSAAEYPVVLWPGVWLPQILPPEPPACTRLLWNAHFYLAFLFFALILMHVAAALFHALIRRDGVLDSMGPELTHDEVAPAE